MGKLRTFALLAAAAVLCSTIAVQPAAAAGAGGDKAWRFDLAPYYGWFVNIDGTTGIGPVDQETKVDFGDIWDNLEAIFTTHFEARKGCGGGIVDVSYLNLGPGGTLPNGARADVDL